MKINQFQHKFKREISYGEIKFYNRKKKYGFITETESGNEFFFMNKDAAIQEERLICYLPVSFSIFNEPLDNPIKNRRAILVREIE